jgi:hypothetical protein
MTIPYYVVKKGSKFKYKNNKVVDLYETYVLAFGTNLPRSVMKKYPDKCQTELTRMENVLNGTIPVLDFSRKTLIRLINKYEIFANILEKMDMTTVNDDGKAPEREHAETMYSDHLFGQLG